MFIPSVRRLAVVSVLVLMSTVSAQMPVLAARRLESVEMPRSLKVEPELLPQLEQMLVLSPTFKEQCLRLDETERLVIVLRRNPLLPRSLFRARSTIRRYSSGLLVVTVEVAPGSDQPEWIAHEFEHVLEMLDGEKLADKASHFGPGVWRSVEGMYETTRATEVGRNVLFEMREVDASDKFVE